MRTWSTFIKSVIRKGIPIVHCHRLNAVTGAVTALVRGARPTVTSLGRNIEGTAEKYGIKRMDRLCGNPRLAEETETFQGWVANALVKGNKRPIILVDWSTLSRDGAFQMIVASLTVRRRGLPIYAEVHPQKLVPSASVHKQFLSTLKKMLPEGCRPIIVADAGFRGTFCRQVESLGWDYVVRLRGKTYVRAEGSNEWIGGKSLHAVATTKPRDLGRFDVARANPVSSRLILARRPSKGRKRKTCFGKDAQWTNSRNHAASAREPWLLQTSLQAPTAKRVVTIYAHRMGIEESLRDTKNLRCGRGLSCSLSRSTTRLNILAMLDVLAAFFLWIIGMAADAEGLTRRYQANTITKRAVLSLPYLGRRLTAKPPPDWPSRILKDALGTLCTSVNSLETRS